MQAKPEVLMIGPYPAWDMEDLNARYVVAYVWFTSDTWVETNVGNCW
jgi:hypothetical protein